MGTSFRNGDVDPKSGFCAANGVYYSRRGRIELPSDPFCTFPGLLFESREYDHLAAYVDATTGRTLKYKQLRESVKSVAAGLAGFGVRKGDVVLLLLPNSAYFTVIMLGVMTLGAVVTATNPLNTPAEILKQMGDSGTKFVCTIPALLEKLDGSEQPLILISDGDDSAAKASTASRRCTSLSKLLQSDPAEVPYVPVAQDDTAALLYSSGTTGASKGVIITHRNLIAQRFLILGDDESSWTDRVYLCFLPMFHVYGLAVFASGVLAKGCTTLIMPKFDMVEMLELIQKHRITHLPVAPPILSALTKLKIVDMYDLSSLVQVGSGSAPLSRKVQSAFRARFPNTILAQGYGLTESTAVGATTVTEEECEHYGSSGLITANMEAKVVDIETGNPLPPNKQGEIWLRGPTIMKGYFGNPGATAATLDAERWLHTGDIGYIDQEGYLFVVDRLKELIKYKGFQVAPAELEAVLHSHPEIIDAAVIPLPDEDAGEIPLAVIVRNPGSTLTEVGVIEFVADQVAPYKRVRRVAFVSSIPKSSSGKTLRRALVMQMTSKL